MVLATTDGSVETFLAFFAIFLFFVAVAHDTFNNNKR